MTPTPKLASGAVARAGAGGAGTAAAGAGTAAGAAEPGPFVLNLCSSTTPMALEQAQIPELKRFTFFVSRRREEGRERFRLHMGYFASLEEAEELLNIVRDIYPGAWAGETPGKKLRERAAAEAAARAQQGVGAQANAAAPQNSVRTTVQPSAAVSHTVAAAVHRHATPPVNVPTLHAAAPAVHPPAAIPVGRPANTRAATPHQAAASHQVTVASQSPPRAPTPAARNSAASPGRQPVAPSASRAAPPAAGPASRAATPTAAARGATPAKAAAPAKAPAPARPPAPRAFAPAIPKPVVAARPAASKVAAPASGAARAPQPAVPASPTPVAPRSPAQPVAAARRAPGVPAAAKPAARPVGSRATSKASLPGSNVREVLAALDETTGETRMMPSPSFSSIEPPADGVALTDTQVLRFLETRRDDDAEQGEQGVDEGESSSISLLKPDDTGTRRALKEAVVQNAPVSFAVQLQWSVQPVELDKVPPLAIFSAYTLYTVEGSRDGRKWYGLRLGFFTDAISAKQVAYYVRSEFASVAVVPVSPQERMRASEDDKKTGGLTFPKKPSHEPVDEFKLFDEPVAAPAPAAPPVRPAAPATAKPSGSAASGKRGNRVRAREHRSPQTLEETLEILGASQLEIDNGSGETLNDSGVRHLRVEVQKNTPFRRLIERLSERARKG